MRQLSIGKRRLPKPVPEGTDDWSHPYHGPDNNPQSQDTTRARSFSDAVHRRAEVQPDAGTDVVVGGGRIFKAMGHIAHKANQNEMLNTLLCINAYNGTILGVATLSEGFMIHRNTMIAARRCALHGRP